MLAAYGLLAVLFVAPASAEAFAGERDLASPRAILGRLMVLIAFGWGITVLVLLTALATLNLSYWHGTLIAPAVNLFAAILVCSLWLARRWELERRTSSQSFRRSGKNDSPVSRSSGFCWHSRSARGCPTRGKSGWKNTPPGGPSFTWRGKAPSYAL